MASMLLNGESLLAYFNSCKMACCPLAEAWTTFVGQVESSNYFSTGHVSATNLFTIKRVVYKMLFVL